MNEKRYVSKEEQTNLLETLKKRFGENRDRHPGIDWSQVENRLTANPEKLMSLYAMEKTEGEPDVVKYDPNSDQYIFVDCSKESPKGRRSVCYDQEALEKRKKFKPAHSALEMAKEMGVEILSEGAYRELQQLGAFDNVTSSWLKTPEDIRKSGGAIFGDRRYGQVFIYHNGADSYYAARGFRALLKV